MSITDDLNRLDAADGETAGQGHDAELGAETADLEGSSAPREPRQTAGVVFRLPNGRLYSKECEYDQSGRDLQWPHWTHGEKRFATEWGIWLFSTIAWAFMLVYGVQAAGAQATACLASARASAGCTQVEFYHGPVVIALVAIIVMELLIAAGCAGSRLWNPEHEDRWFTTAAWWDVAWACALAASAAAMLVVSAAV